MNLLQLKYAFFLSCLHIILILNTQFGNILLIVESKRNEAGPVYHLKTGTKLLLNVICSCNTYI